MQADGDETEPPPKTAKKVKKPKKEKRANHAELDAAQAEEGDAAEGDAEEVSLEGGSREARTCTRGEQDQKRQDKERERERRQSEQDSQARLVLVRIHGLRSTQNGPSHISDYYHVAHVDVRSPIDPWAISWAIRSFFYL